MKTVMIAAAIATIGLAAVPALAQDAAENIAATAPAYSSATTTIGVLIDNPVTRAIVDKYLPGFSSNPQVEMGRGLTLKQAQAYAPDMLPDDVLAKIDSDLAQLSQD